MSTCQIEVVSFGQEMERPWVEIRSGDPAGTQVVCTTGPGCGCGCPCRECSDASAMATDPDTAGNTGPINVPSPV